MQQAPLFSILCPSLWKRLCRSSNPGSPLSIFLYPSVLGRSKVVAAYRQEQQQWHPLVFRLSQSLGCWDALHCSSSCIDRSNQIPQPWTSVSLVAPAAWNQDFPSIAFARLVTLVLHLPLFLSYQSSQLPCNFCSLVCLLLGITSSVAAKALVAPAFPGLNLPAVPLLLLLQCQLVVVFQDQDTLQKLRKERKCSREVFDLAQACNTGASKRRVYLSHLTR